jgi:hypothetical protein
MAIGNCSGPGGRARTAARTAAVVAALAALLAGCAGGLTPYRTGSSVATGSSTAGTNTAGTTVDGETAANGPVSPPTLFPLLLVGDWSGDDTQGIGSWDLRFDARGRYVLQNDRRGQTITGAAAVQGSRMVFQPDDAAAYSESVQLSGGQLVLDGSVYFRTDSAAGGAAAVAGSWISLEDYNQTLTLTDDGQFQLSNPSQGRASGTYTVSGSTLVLDTRTGIVRVPFSISAATLTVSWPNGSQAQYVRS